MLKLISAVLCMLLCAGFVFSQTGENRTRPQTNRDVQRDSPRRDRDQQDQLPARISPAQTVCANEVPHGWIRTNDQWNPTMCGKPTTITYNVWAIEQYRGRPVGSVMRVCSGVIPRGWVMTDAMWNPGMCGHPSAMTKNVMTIKRIE